MSKKIKVLLYLTIAMSKSTILHASEVPAELAPFVRNYASEIRMLIEQEEKIGHCPLLSAATHILQRHTPILFDETALLCDGKKVDFFTRECLTNAARRNNDCNLLVDSLQHYRSSHHSLFCTNTTHKLSCIHCDERNNVETICHRNPFVINMFFFQNSSGTMTSTYPCSLHENNITLGTTPLHYAFDCYDKAISNTQRDEAHENIRSLIELGANVNAYDYKHETPLYKACEQDHMALLLQYGAFKDVQNNRGMTPLMQHIEHGRFMLAAFLIWNKAALHIENHLGDTVFHLIVRTQDIYFLKFLLYMMLKNDHCIASSHNNNNERPLDIAHKKGHHKMASLLKNFTMELFAEAISWKRIKWVKKLWRENSDWLTVSIERPLGNKTNHHGTASNNKCIEYLERVCKTEAQL